ncbi:MAG: hypothetical protein R2713_17620 [Ilumatobacteraceae bacterium]
MGEGDRLVEHRREALLHPFILLLNFAPRVQLQRRRIVFLLLLA